MDTDLLYVDNFMLKILWMVYLLEEQVYVVGKSNLYYESIIIILLEKLKIIPFERGSGTSTPDNFYK